MPTMTVAEFLNVDIQDDDAIALFETQSVDDWNRYLSEFVASHPGSEVIRDVFSAIPRSIEDVRQSIRQSINIPDDFTDRG